MMKITSTFILVIIVVVKGCNSTAKPGKDLYVKHCQNCHGYSGEGLKGLIPPLTDSKFIAEHQKQIPCWLRNGISEELTVAGKKYTDPMPAMPHLTNVEISNLMNFVNTSFGDNLEKLTIKEIDKMLEDCN